MDDRVQFTVYMKPKIYNGLQDIMSTRKKEKSLQGQKQNEGQPSTQTGIIEEAIKNIYKKEFRKELDV